MSRWRAAPPTNNSMNWEPTYGALHHSPSYNRLSHFSSPLSLNPYKLLGPNDAQPLIDPSKSAPTLPVELYRSIIQHFTTPHDLSVLARVSRAFQVEAERFLYHTLHMRHHISTLWRCESLSNQPRLAMNVRKLNITIDQYTPLDSISRALTCCLRLRSLSLKGAAWSDYSKVLDAVRSTEIRDFACHGRGEAGVVRFLERQHDLVEIDFEAHSFDLEDLSAHAVSNLQSFTGWLTTAATLVPGRPVQKLLLTSDMCNDATGRAINQLSLGRADVQVLNIQMGMLKNPIPWSIVETIFVSLKGLKFLGTLSLDCARHPSFPFYLMGLPNLQTIVFGAGTDDFAKYDEHGQRDMVYRLGQACESLTQVIICIPMWSNEWIWKRDSRTRRNPFCGYQGHQEWWGGISREPVKLEELARLHVPSDSSSQQSLSWQ